MGKDISLELVENAKLAIEPDVPDSRRLYVKVGKNDSLASIARRNNVSVAELKAWNDLHTDSVARGKSLLLHVPVRQAAHSAGARKEVAASTRGKKPAVARTAHGSKTTVAKASARTVKKAPARITLASER